MASTDARPVPRKNTAYRCYFPILDADGDPVTGATALDSEVSIDGGAFADCTNEATEIGSTGLYYLDLTAGEMNGDGVVVRVQTSTAGAKTTTLVFYPEEPGDIRADAVMISGDATAADNLEAAADGTGYPLGGVLFTGIASYGVLDAGAGASFTLPAGQRASVAQGQVIWIPGKGDGRVIATYNSGTGVGTVDPAFDSAAAASDAYVVFAQAASPTTPPSVNLTQISGAAVSTSTAQLGVNVVSMGSAAVQSIWDALTSALTTVGSIGKRIADYLTGDAFVRLGAPSGASIAADIQTRATAAALTTAQTDLTTLTGRLTATRAGLLDNLSNLNAAVNTLATAANLATVSTNVSTILAAVDTEVAAILAAVDTEIAAIKAKTDNLPASPAAVGSAMTLTSGERDSVADALLARNIAGGSSTGRTVKQALAVNRNRVVLDESTGALTVYDTDDTTPLWTGVGTFASRNALREINPA